MARPRKDPSKKPTKERILNAARQHFAHAGYAHGNLADIATEAGITRPSLLYHFDTKERLYRTVVGSAMDELAASLMGQMAVPGDFQTRLLTVTESFFDFLSEKPWFAPLILRDFIDGKGPVREFLMQQGAAIIDAIESWILDDGATIIPDGLNVRGALLQVICHALVRESSPDPLRERLWGAFDDPLQYSRLIFFKGSGQ